MKIVNCTNCKSKKLSKIFSLGKLSFSGRFAKTFSEVIPSAQLNLIMCKVCKLVQLDRSFDPKYLYGKGYGYRTGINKTMTEHVKQTVRYAAKIANLEKKDCVLDIASNDGTLLSFYPKNITTVGIDPLINKYKSFYNKIDFYLSFIIIMTSFKLLNLPNDILSLLSGIFTTQINKLITQNICVWTHINLK